MNILIYSIKFIHINSQKTFPILHLHLIVYRAINEIEKSTKQKYKKNMQSSFSYKITDKSIIA